MVWVVGVAATILLLVVLSVYAYGLALDDGLATKYEALPKPLRLLTMVWRGFVMMAALSIVMSMIAFAGIVFAPLVLPLSAMNQSGSRRVLYFAGAFTLFSILVAGGAIYLAEGTEGYLRYLAWAIVAWACLGLAGTAIGLRGSSDDSDRPEVSPALLSKCLEDLAKCGICLRQGVSVEDMLDEDAGYLLSSNTYDGVVMIMGGWGKSLAEPTFSDDVWYNDIECITQPEDYARVARHLQRLSKGDFAIENVRAETDEDGAEVALKFTLHGKDYDLWAPLNDDMIEVEVWAELQGLFESCCKEGRRLESILYGQDGCYFYITGEQKECLEKLGLKFFR